MTTKIRVLGEIQVELAPDRWVPLASGSWEQVEPLFDFVRESMAPDATVRLLCTDQPGGTFQVVRDGAGTFAERVAQEIGQAS